ncbi:hypothetical protein C8R45DRAFT_1210820 [Mycena sanguinolenta]|nr:hypothetical protein C8R45DRAFT_1210820 [Mycena sanguinolenta]
MLSTPNSDSFITSSGQAVMYDILGLIAQTFVFGVYSVLNFMSTRLLLQRGLKTKVHKILFSITTFMYLLSAAYWCYSIANVTDRMRVYIQIATNKTDFSSQTDAVVRWSPLFNASVYINYALSDGIVIWRAWVICLRSHRKYMWIPVCFLALTTLSVFATIGLRLATLNTPSMPHLAEAMNIAQMSAVSTSLISNLSSMGVIGVTLWRHWRTIRTAFPDKKQRTKTANRTLILVVESGILYSVSAITLLLFSVIPGRLPTGNRLGDLYGPINIQLAGAYPSIVLLLVSGHGSLNDSTFSNDDITPNQGTSEKATANSVHSIGPTIYITNSTEQNPSTDSDRPSNRWSEGTFV